MGTFTKLTYHIVFSTKGRYKSLTEEIQEKLYSYIGGIVRSQKGHLIEIDGVEDHIHILLNIAPTMALSDVAREIKASSSKWMNQLSNETGRFEWQKGYGAFTVSYSQIDLIRNYIQNQKEHHKTKTFEDEYMNLLLRHEIVFEKKYLFEHEYFG